MVRPKTYSFHDTMAKLNPHSNMWELTDREYNKLLEDRNWLRCLEAAGVDNWDGISYAYELSGETDDEDDESE